ncbi:MAG TPA: IS1634 family transposase [Methyloceanibacter sp.]|nr:IS1634 family transposase [Methyloceanibacter sp.]
MFIETVPNRNSPPAVLLRETWREGGKVKKRTLLNLTSWPAERVEGLRILLKGGTALPPGEVPFTIMRSLPHGHVAGILGAIRATGLDRILGPDGNRPRDLVLAMIINRIIAPGSKLATARMLDEPTACTSTGKVLGLGPVEACELYQALDWLLVRQPDVEKKLARKHLKSKCLPDFDKQNQNGGCLVLYDVSSSYVEGRCCDLARFGYNRDGKKGKMQIVYGLLCAADGCPVAVEVFEGNTGDPKTLAAQIEKLKQRFSLDRVVLVGDRGMITDARIREELQPAGLDWITALRAPAIQALAAENGPLQMSLFDERDMAEISAPDYPGERLIVCRNRELATERARKRQALLEATEKALTRIQAAVERKRNPLRGKAEIGLAVGAVVGKHKMAKHFELTIEDASFSFHRKQAEIAAEAALDGLYVIRTSLPEAAIGAADAVSAYKSLSQVERAFRSLKSVDLDIRPIHHWLSDRVRAHVFLCLLSYYVDWHMRQALAPMLFDDEDKDAALASRASPVAKAPRSERAKAKDAGKRSEDGEPVHSFHTLIADLGTLCLNEVAAANNPNYVLTMATRATPLQHKALGLLGVSPAATQ